MQNLFFGEDGGGGRQGALSGDVQMANFLVFTSLCFKAGLTTKSLTRKMICYFHTSRNHFHAGERFCSWPRFKSESFETQK